MFIVNIRTAATGTVTTTHHNTVQDAANYIVDLAGGTGAVATNWPVNGKRGVYTGHFKADPTKTWSIQPAS